MLEQASDDLNNKHTQNLNSFRNKSFNHHEFSPVDITEKRHQFGLKYRNSIRKLSSSMFPIRDGKFIVSLEASAENTPVSTRWKKPIGLSQLNDSTSESISKSFNVIARDGSIESRKVSQVDFFDWNTLSSFSRRDSTTLNATEFYELTVLEKSFMILF